jgi:hypothetical protein
MTNVTSSIVATVGTSTVTGDPADAAQDILDLGPVTVPLLSEWMLILLAGLLALFGLRRLLG